MFFFVTINSFPLSLSLAVLEGIAIGFNRDYKVLGSTYPWIARKVLTDSSPKLKSSLQALLYKVNLWKLSFPSIMSVLPCTYINLIVLCPNTVYIVPLSLILECVLLGRRVQNWSSRVFAIRGKIFFSFFLFSSIIYSHVYVQIELFMLQTYALIASLISQISTTNQLW